MVGMLSASVDEQRATKADATRAMATPHLKKLVEDERSQQSAGSASALGHAQGKANQHRMEGNASLQDL